MKIKLRANQAFSLLELMVVITIIAILASVSGPTYTKAVERARLMKDVSNQKQIVIACKLYAQDFDGDYPNSSEDGEFFSDSTAAFNELIKEVDLGTEMIFFQQNKAEPSKRKQQPDDNAILEVEENGYSYVVGLSDSSSGGSPLTADATEGGTYPDSHPWLQSKKAVVGYCGGHVVIEKLSGRAEGATVIGPRGSGIDDIFQPAEVDEETGETSGGRLAKGGQLIDP